MLALAYVFQLVIFCVLKLGTGSTIFGLSQTRKRSNLAMAPHHAAGEGTEISGFMVM